MLVRMSYPLTMAVPWLGVLIPARRARVADLPLPLSPQSAVMWLSYAFKWTLRIFLLSVNTAPLMASSSSTPVSINQRWKGNTISYSGFDF